MKTARDLGGKKESVADGIYNFARMNNFKYLEAVIT